MKISHLLFLSFLVTAASAAADGAEDDVAQQFAACAACHGAHGEGATSSAGYVPPLSGKPAGYLLDQLRAFRDGRRSYAPMVWLTRNLDDNALQAMADYYALQAPPAATAAPGGPLDEASRRRAEHLVYEGDATRPACAACHGAELAGLEPGVPALAGLPADYVIAQLGAWRTGVRRGRAPDCMADVARALPAKDLRLLGEWLAAQGHDTPRRPATAGSFELPVDCGETRGGGAR